MRLSYSAISTYLKCPLQYRFQYLEGRPGEPSPALSFGSSLHSALEWLYSSPTGEAPSLDALLEQLECCWESDGYESPEEEARYFLQGKSTLALYYRNNVANLGGGFSLPAAIEHKFAIDLGFCDLSGVIDRLDRDLEGGFEIIDYKTNRRLPPARRLQEDLQLPLYQIAAKRIWEVPVSRVTFHYLMMDHKASFFITPEREADALASVRRVAQRIEAEDFAPCRNNLCPWCDYSQDCPLFEGNPPARKRPAAPPLDVGEAVDELISSQARVAAGLARIEGLKDYIASYLERNAIERVGGSTGSAFFDEDGNLSWCEEDRRLF
jgi:putative RecB family exonuclease